MISMPITLLIIGVTAIVSFMAFNDRNLFNRLMHYPYEESRRGEYYRWITCGFLHADYGHLFMNMITLYFFGGFVEAWFKDYFPMVGPLLYLVFYLLSIAAAASSTYFKHRDNQGFASIGASGATAAVLFASILLNPTIGILLFFIPIPIPGFIFGILYLVYSTYAERQGRDNINHAAHFFGAVFGFLFLLILQPTLFRSFIMQIGDWFQRF